MTTPSGDPYVYGDDTVAARLEVDIPVDAISNLADLSRHTADIRANMEATAKYNQDYVEYLRQLPTALGEVETAQGRLSSSRSSIFGGEAVVSDDRTPTATFVDGQAGAGRTLRSDIDQDTLINLARDNPRQVANMAADRGIDDYFDGDQSRVLPRPAPAPGPGASSGRSGQFAGGGRPPSAPTSPRASTGPGDDDGRAAGTTTGRQVTPEGTESQVERAAARLLEQLESRDAEAPDANQRLRSFGSGFENNQLLNYLTTEGGIRGRGNAMDFAGGLGSMAQQAGEGFTQRYEEKEAERASLLSTAADVAAVNPELAERLTARAGAMGGSLGRMGAIAPLAKGLGIAGAGIAGVAAVNAGVQKAGEWAHSVQGHGVQMGGGFNEGLAFETSIRTMAMNPFISTEQSRKIMQEALQSGYTGKEMDTVTEFMAENLKKMNMDAAESMKMLQKNVILGGQDIDSLQAQLSGNVALAREGNLSTNDINQQFSQISGQAVDAGSGGAEGGMYAQNLIASVKDDPILSEAGATDLANAAFTSNAMQREIAREAGIVGEVLTEHVPSYLMSQEGGSANLAKNERDVIKRVLMPIAVKYARPGATARDKSSAVRQAQNQLRRLGLNWDTNQTANVLAAVADGTWDERTKSGLEEAQVASGGDMEVSSSDSNFMSMIGSRTSAAAKSTFGSMIGHEGIQESADRDYEDSRRYGNRWLAGGETYVPEVLAQLASEHHNDNARDVEFVDEDGEAKKIGDRLTDEEFMKRVQRGDVKLKIPGQENAMTLGEWGGSQESSVSSASGNMFGIHVDLTREAKDLAERLLNITYTGNEAQRKADRGDGAKNEADLHPFGN